MARFNSGGMARLVGLMPDQSDAFCFADVLPRRISTSMSQYSHLSEPDPELAALLAQTTPPAFGTLVPADVPRVRPLFVSALIRQIKERYGPQLPPGGRIFTTVQDSFMLRPRFAIHGGKPHNRSRGGQDLRPCYHADTDRGQKPGISGHGLVSWRRCADVPQICFNPLLKLSRYRLGPWRSRVRRFSPPNDLR